MADFELSYATLTTQAGALIVPDITVRLKSPSRFSFSSGSLPSCSSPTPPLGHPQPFLRLDPSLSTTDTDPRYQIARLVFDQNAIGDWHTPFDECGAIFQMLQITGQPAKRVTINLSCLVDPLVATHPLAKLAINVGQTFVAVASAIVLFLKRVFGKPVALLEEQSGREASTSTR